MRFRTVALSRAFQPGSRPAAILAARPEIELVPAPWRPGLSEAEVTHLVEGAHAIVVGLEPITERVMAACPELRVVARIGVGYDNVDVAAATRRRVAVTTTPGANDVSVAEHTLALILALARRLTALAAETAAGGWPRRLGTELAGKTLGVVGTGRIGRQVVARAVAFGMRVLCHDVYPDEAWAAAAGARYVPLDVVVREADVLTLHVPLSPATRHLIDRRRLSLMKPEALLINTARGGLVDEDALYEALVGGNLAGAALDVFSHEPPEGSPLLHLDNVVATPHAAALTVESVERMCVQAAEAVVEVLAGRMPKGIVNPEVFGEGAAVGNQRA